MVRSRRGFTFIEMLVVFVIAGVVMGLTAGLIEQFMIRRRLSLAAAALTNDVRQAFALAGQERKPVRLQLDTVKMELDVLDRGSGAVLRRTSFGSAYQLTAKNVSFYPSAPLVIFPGGLAADSMSVTFSALGSARNIKVSRAGMVQLRVVP